MPQLNVGFIGLGYIGKPMCRNLLEKGFPVTVWNRSRPGIEYAVSFGATEAGSAREVAERSDVVVTMVKHGGDTAEVALGMNGLLAGAKPGMVLVDHSTIAPSEARDIAAKLADGGVLMLDAPVSGSTMKAEAGTLSIMVGGPKEAFDKALPVMQAMGTNIVHIGEQNGAGQGAKICNQILVTVNMLAVSEALTMAGALGLDVQRVYEAIKDGAAASFQLEQLGSKLMVGDWEPGGTVETMQKDLGIMLGAGRELHMPLPATALVSQLYNAAEAAGAGKKGHQALVAGYEVLTGIHIPDHVGKSDS